MSEHSDDPSVIAGEYVLGLLDGAQMRAVEQRAQEDRQLASEIAFWEDRLAPLAQMVPPVPAPSVLWARLALATGIGGGQRRNAGSSPRLWQATTAASMAIAASFAFLAFLPRPPLPNPAGAQFVAAIAPANTPVPFLAQTHADGSITITRLTSATPPAGRDFELWELPKGATKPVSLGVLPPGQQIVHPAERPMAETQLMVSDEPAGGSPTGLPTGNVLFGGTLTPIGPAPASSL
jgi:anti-sigma-K factor RskA